MQRQSFKAVPEARVSRQNVLIAEVVGENDWTLNASAFPDSLNGAQTEDSSHVDSPDDRVAVVVACTADDHSLMEAFLDGEGMVVAVVETSNADRLDYDVASGAEVVAFQDLDLVEKDCAIKSHRSLLQRQL